MAYEVLYALIPCSARIKHGEKVKLGVPWGRNPAGGRGWGRPENAKTARKDPALGGAFRVRKVTSLGMESKMVFGSHPYGSQSRRFGRL